MTDIQSLTQQAWTLLCRLCSIPRVSRDEYAAANLLELYMMQHGLHPQRSGHNLWCVKDGYNPARPTLMLNAHIDTVSKAPGQRRQLTCSPDYIRPENNHIWPENNHTWLENNHMPDKIPYAAGAVARAYGIEEDRLGRLNRLEARGANDDGASLVSLLHVFMALPQQSYNLVFLASAEEEVSGRGGIESVLPLLPHIDVALVGEPTQMQPAIAEKGLMVIDATAHGVAGHAARDEGDNAILRAIRDIERLSRGDIFTRVSPLLGAVKTTVTIINAGTVHNVIPDTCTYTIDVRSNELYTNQEILDTLSATLESELHARSTRLSSSRIDAAHPLVRRAVELGRVPFGSPTLSDQALLPMPSLKMGPGDSRRSHTADEYILKEEIEEGISLYLQLLDGLKIDLF